MKTAAGKLGDTQQLFPKELKVSCSSLRTLQVLGLGSVPQTLVLPWTGGVTREHYRLGMHKQALGNKPDTAMGVLPLSQRGEN